MPISRSGLLVMLTLFCLSGCAQDAHQVPITVLHDQRIADQVSISSVGKIFGQQAGVQVEDPLNVNDNPMLDNGGSKSDPLLFNGGALNGNALSSPDALANGDLEGGQAHQRSIKNWYWIRGTISGGTVSLKINGVFVQQFSVHVDAEISDYLNPGNNDITFIPQPSIADQPVACHLDIVYSQQPAGSLPVLTYDTTVPLMQGSQQTNLPSSAPPPGSAPAAGTPPTPGASTTFSTPSGASQTASAAQQYTAPVTLDFDAQ